MEQIPAVPPPSSGSPPIQNSLLGNTTAVSTRLQGWREPRQPQWLLAALGNSQHPLSSAVRYHRAHTSHLKQRETHIVLKDDAADAPHVAGLAPAKL